MDSLIPQKQTFIWKSLFPLLLCLILFVGCKDSLPGEDSMTRLDKSNQQPVKTLQNNCTDKCHKAGTFMDPVLINGEGSQGKHKKHVAERGLYCTICHYNYSSMESHRNNILDTNDPEVQIVFFNPMNWNPEDDRKGEWIEDQGIINGVATGGCSSLYCHGKRETDIGIPRWYEDVSFECTYCHNPGSPIDPTTNYEKFPAEKHPEGFVYSGEACKSCHPGFVTSQLVPANAHTRHVTDVGFACEMCHLGYKEKVSHANGTLDSAKDVMGKINFDPILNPQGEYDSATKTCNNLYCHGDTWGGEASNTDKEMKRSSISQGADTTPVWTNLSTGDCGSCHKADPNHSQGSHTKHLNPPYSFPCYKCHFDNRGKAREAGGVVTRLDHHVKEGLPVNGVVNVIFDKNTLPANPTGIFDPETKTCQSLYCHGEKLPKDYNRTTNGAIIDETLTKQIPNWNWGPGFSNPDKPNPWCGSCHDVDGEDFSNGTVRSTGRHSLHLSDGTGEDLQNGPKIENCTRCHPGSFDGLPEDSRTYVQAASHVNGIISFNQTNNPILGIENLWGSEPTSQWAMIDDWTLDEGKTCTNACHAQQPESLNFLHSDLKKQASYSTTANPEATVNSTGTTTCDNCHSPEGDYDGVNDPSIGSKFNWLDGVYATGSGEDFTNPDQTELKIGKEKWCAGCHDKSPSIIDTKFEGVDVTVDAPQVIGDETAPSNYGMGWGFYKTGHGVPKAERMPWTGTDASRDSSGNWSADGRPGPGKECTACHNPKLPHIDGKHRTFDCTDRSLCEPEYYQSGYRLRKVNDNPPLEVPRTRVMIGTQTQDMQETQIRLCSQCHDTSRVLTGNDETTNFRSDGRGNLHYLHLNNYGPRVDADWRLNLFGISNYSGGGTGLLCITCHNVHGSNQLAMIRNGSLTEGRMMKIHYRDATTKTIADPGNSTPCHEIDILEATSDHGILLGDSDGSVFCGKVEYYSGSGMCWSHCHGSLYDFERGVDRTPPYPLTTPE